MKCEYVLFCLGKDVYSIVFQGISGDFDKLAGDFEKILGSISFN